MAGLHTLLDRKRLELAHVSTSEPKLLLVDEIAGGLTDDRSRQWVSLVRLTRDRGVKIVWIEHALHAMMAVADRIMVLNFDEMIPERLPADMMNNPDVKRVHIGIDA